MEKKRVAIISVKKNEITINLRKKSRSYSGFSIFIIIAFLTCFSLNIGDIKNIGFSMAQIYNPVSSLYNDNSDVVFTNALIETNNLDFVVPLMGSNYEINTDGTIVFEVTSSIMVKSCESGYVDEIGTTNNGVKYIKIKHSDTIWSLYENVDIVGIQKNEIVKKGQDIATAKIGAKVYFQIFNGDVRISNLKINAVKIVWEN